MQGLSSTAWDTLFVEASSPEADNMQKTVADLRRTGAARGARTHTRMSGPDQVSPAEEQHGRHANGTRPIDLVGPTVSPSAEPNLRRGSILQAGQNVLLSEHQESHTEYRVARETIARYRSTQSNRGSAQIRTSTAHGHGTRAASVSGRCAEDVKIMVMAFLAERGVQANSKAWHNAMQSEHIQRMTIAHEQSEEGAKATRDRAIELLVSRVARHADGCLLHLSSQHVGSTCPRHHLCPQHLYVKYKTYHHPGRTAMQVVTNSTMLGPIYWNSSRCRAAQPEIQQCQTEGSSARLH